VDPHATAGAIAAALPASDGNAPASLPDAPPGLPRGWLTSARAASAQAEPAPTADAVPADAGDEVDVTASRTVVTAAPAGAAAAAAREAVPSPAAGTDAPADLPRGVGRDETPEPATLPAQAKGTPTSDASRADSRRSARDAIRAALAGEHAATPAVAATPATPAASPVSRAAVAAAHPGPTSDPGLAAGTGVRPRAGAPRVDARQAVDTVAFGASPVSTGEHGGSAREGRSSSDPFVPLRTTMAAPRAVDVAAIADGVLANAWATRLAQAGAAPPETATLTTASAEAWGVPDQIVRGLQLQVRNGAGEAVIRLRPEHLGELVVEMRVEQERVVATLKSDTPAVRAWIAAHRDDLEAGLADAGLRLDDLRVSEREGGQDRRDQRHESDTPKRRPRRAPATDTRFEILA
jgi:flagellar hook-length control protein FliK